jgi:hypothetical protein
MPTKKKPTRQDKPIQYITKYPQPMVEDVLVNNISFSDFLAKYGFSRRVYDEITQSQQGD